MRSFYPIFPDGARDPLFNFLGSNSSGSLSRTFSCSAIIFRREAISSDLRGILERALDKL